STCAGDSGSPLPAGGMRSSTSVEPTRLISSLLALFPGTRATFPDLSGPNALAGSWRLRPAFFWSGPWHLKQRPARIGRMSRLKLGQWAESAGCPAGSPARSGAVTRTRMNDKARTHLILTRIPLDIELVDGGNMFRARFPPAES